MHTLVLNSRVILIVCKRVQQTVLDSWRRKGLRENNRWRLRTKCISQLNSSVTWANTIPTLVVNCRVVLIYSIVRLISHDQIVYEEIIFCKTSSRIKSIELSELSFTMYNRAARAVQRRQRPEAKEQWHNDMNPLDARSGLKWMFNTKEKRKPNYKQN